MKPEFQIIKGGKEALREKGRYLLFKGICLGDKEALREAQEDVYLNLARRANLRLASSRGERDHSE